MTTTYPTANLQLDEWLHEQVGDARTELITDHPWAQTYRVFAGAATYYLKTLPKCQRAGMAAIATLSRRFTKTVPEVVALDELCGRMLLRDHGGRDLGGSADLLQRRGVLKTYAGIQAASVHDGELQAQLPHLDLADLTTRFCEFFERSNGAQSNQVGAAHFLGDDRAEFYFERISARLPILQRSVLDALRLPATINHCDLRMQNTAVADDGTFLLFDWDEAIAGPAGLSLHNFFSGCSAVLELPAKCGNGDSDDRQALLDSYIQSLVDGGYAGRDLLECALPGAACAGVMHYLMSYGKFPLAEQSDREQVAKIFVRRLDDLLAFCDQLAISQRATVVRLVDDYETADAPERALRLLSRYLEQTPSDLELQARLGFVLRYLGEHQDAERHCRRALAIDPTHAELRYLLGRILLERMAIDDAVEQTRLAATFAPGDESIRRSLSEVVLLQELEQNAARSGCVPTIRFTEEERSEGAISKAKRRLAGRLFREYGTLVVENVFDTTLMDRLANRFEEQYRAYLSNDRPDDALKVGNRRFMITVDVADAFNTSDLYAAPLLTPILDRLLGDDFILGSFTAVTSLPGAADMRMHKDHPALFSEDELPGPQPTVGVTTLIPLKGFDLTMGTTRVVKGSHRRSSEESAEMEWQDPCAPKGSCLLMDYRLSHQGLANRSPFVRPVLSVVYNRPWFRDCVNYELQEPLRIARSEFDRVPETWQRLFAWTRP